MPTYGEKSIYLALLKKTFRSTWSQRVGSKGSLIMIELQNRPMINEDVQWVREQPEYVMMKELIFEYSRQELPLFNGNVRCSNISPVDDGFKLTHWYRMWEYLSIYNHVIKTLPAEAKILDCGGAGSYFPFWLGEQGRQITVIDIQRFHTMLSDVVATVRGLSHLTFSVQDMTDIAAEDETYDCVYSVSVLEHLPISRRHRAMAEIYRVLKPGGVLALTFDFGKDVNIHAEKVEQNLQCIKNIEEITELFMNLPFRLIGNKLKPEMNRYRERRPNRIEFECRYMLIQILSANSSLREVLKYFFLYFAYHIYPKIAYRFVRGSTGYYNFFRLFLEKE